MVIEIGKMCNFY